jgi:hypothetical protein
MRWPDRLEFAGILCGCSWMAAILDDMHQQMVFSLLLGTLAWGLDQRLPRSTKPGERP